MDPSDAARLSRRSFLRAAGLGAAALHLAPGAAVEAAAAAPGLPASDTAGRAAGSGAATMIGAYGPWAAGLAPDPPVLSWRRPAFTDLDAWRASARERLLARLASPDAGAGVPVVTVLDRHEADGLQVEHLAWRLPYGPPAEGVLLKPAGAEGPLPGVLALHDHGGDKVFGWQKIARTGAPPHPLMARTQEVLYEGRAWANELARRGYVVLAPDAFAFGSRRVRLADVPEKLRGGLPATEPETPDQIAAYNRWAKAHEHVMARSLFSAGTTWPGVFLAEDRRALDVLCARADVDAARVGCGGLSGGGLRTVYLGGADPRVRCAVCVGMMTTWDDFVLHKSATHTWMVYPPLLPRELEYPEILGVRVPLPTLVQSNEDDPLFTLAEMRRADEILRAVYAKAGAEEHYRGTFHPGPHKFDRAMQDDAFAWFDRWL